MKIKRRKKKKNKNPPTCNIKRRKPRAHYTKEGHLIIEDKPWDRRVVPCRECWHWNKSLKMYIAEDGTEGWICPKTNEPRLHNEKVICKHFKDNWIVVKRGPVREKIDNRPSMKIKRRRKKRGR